MSPSNPPRLAQWLLERYLSGPRRESMIGDIVEQHQRGRSASWYWRQSVRAIIASVADEAWRHRWLAVTVVALGIALPDIYMLIHVRWVARLDRLWYPQLIESSWSWMAINPWAYRLELYSLTSRFAWCLLVAAVAWTTTRWRARQRGLVVTLLVVTLVGQSLPYLWIALTTWLREPGNPMSFFGFFWFALFTLAAVPASILLAGRGVSSARWVSLDAEQGDGHQEPVSERGARTARCRLAPRVPPARSR